MKVVADQYSPDAIAGIESFSHLVVVYHFLKVDPATIELVSRHPRENTAWPKVGIFAQRGKNRPNLLGATVCQIVGVEGLRIMVRRLDAVDGIPVLDLKPHMKGFEPRGDLWEPDWAGEIMSKYWFGDRHNCDR